MLESGCIQRNKSGTIHKNLSTLCSSSLLRLMDDSRISDVPIGSKKGRCEYCFFSLAALMVFLGGGRFFKGISSPAFGTLLKTTLVIDTD